MSEQAFFTVGEAAKQVGRSKATLSNAIKTGRLSVQEKTSSGYRIAASELFRAFPPDDRSTEQRQTPAIEQVNSPVLAEMEGLRRENALLRDERDDLRRRLDTEGEERRRLTAILMDNRQAPTEQQQQVQKSPEKRRRWPWRFLGGRTTQSA